MCWYCGSPITDETIGRSLRCSTCGRDLRICRHCRFFLPSGSGNGSAGDCSESGAEPVADRERANFCDWFSLNQKFRGPTAGQGKEQNRAAEARSAFDNLFK